MSDKSSKNSRVSLHRDSLKSDGTVWPGKWHSLSRIFGIQFFGGVSYLVDKRRKKENRKCMKIYQVDSFTSVKFKGNPAGVCILDKFLETHLMQSIAAEMNLSETAFVEIQDRIFKIRYFTPTKEVPLCGHATLASAHIFYESGIIPANQKFVFKA